MTDDVVAELDAELALIEPLPYRVPIHHLAQRARDEIVALRAFKARVFADVRDEALEEAARVCDALYDGYSTAKTDQTDPEQVWLDACDRAATAIRALKEKR